MISPLDFIGAKHIAILRAMSRTLRLIGVWIAVPFLMGSDWPRFRGPSGSGIGAGAKPPLEFGLPPEAAGDAQTTAGMRARCAKSRATVSANASRSPCAWNGPAMRPW